MAELKISDLPPSIPSRTHIIPAFKDNTTVTLTVGQLLDLLVDAAPGSLDTLNELAAALGDNPNFAATVLAQLALKADELDTDIPSLLAKTNPVDADVFRIWDVAGATFKKVTIADLKAVINALAAASQAQQEAANSNIVAVTPGRQRFHPSSAKAFACVIQSGGAYTLSSSPGSFGVASVAKQATGIVRVTWETAFSLGAYAPIVTVQEGGNFSAVIGATALSYVDVQIRNAGTGGLLDAGFSIVAFGDLP